MILNALADYYDRLLDDPQQQAATFGFARERISFCVVLKPDGSLDSVQDLREEVESGKRKRLLPRKLIVPDRGGRSIAVKSNFLWDNTGYVLGADGKGKRERSAQTFAAFVELHHNMLEKVDDPGLRAVCAFLSKWDPAQAAQLDNWEEVRDTNLVFKIAGQTAFVHDAPALQKAWFEVVSGETESLRGVSLMTGEEEELARLHPMIRGVAGAQSSGASMVSFNKDSFESYGKSQSYNAPLGLRDTFRYTTALNRLVADDRRRMRLADATVLFWTERPTAFEDDFFGVIDAPSKAEDEDTLSRQRQFINSLRSAWSERNRLAEADVPFYFLGLSPNQSRLSVRYWLTGTVQEFAERLGRHMADLDIVGSGDGPPPTLRRLVLETARAGRGGWPDEDSASPLLSGSILRSVLSGTRYPTAWFISVIERVRAEGFANSDKRRDWRDAIHRRAAIIKAYLIRNEGKEISVSLNKVHPEPAYHLGRLFAVLVKTQEEAMGGTVKATIKDRFLSSASANPATAFPRLLRLHSHHLQKLDSTRRKTNIEKLVQEITSNVEAFPSNMGLPDQGLFFIGYYHQRQDLFTSKKTDGEENENTLSAAGARKE